MERVPIFPKQTHDIWDSILILGCLSYGKGPKCPQTNKWYLGVYSNFRVLVIWKGSQVSPNKQMIFGVLFGSFGKSYRYASKWIILILFKWKGPQFSPKPMNDIWDSVRTVWEIMWVCLKMRYPLWSKSKKFLQKLRYFSDGKVPAKHHQSLGNPVHVDCKIKWL